MQASLTVKNCAWISVSAYSGTAEWSAIRISVSAYFGTAEWSAFSAAAGLPPWICILEVSEVGSS